MDNRASQIHARCWGLTLFLPPTTLNIEVLSDLQIQWNHATLQFIRISSILSEFGVEKYVQERSLTGKTPNAALQWLLVAGGQLLRHPSEASLVRVLSTSASPAQPSPVKYDGWSRNSLSLLQPGPWAGGVTMSRLTSLGLTTQTSQIEK